MSNVIRTSEASHVCVWARAEDDQVCLICGGTRPKPKRRDWWLLAAFGAYFAWAIGWITYLSWRAFHGG